MDSSEPPPVGEDGTGARLLRAMSFEEIVQESTTEMGHSVLALRKAVYLEELSKSSRDLLATDDRQTEEDSTEDLPDTTEDLQELAGTVLTQEPEKLMCPCGKALAVPAEIEVFMCPFCELVLQRPRPNAEEESLFALHKWVIRRAVSKELDSWFSGNVYFERTNLTLWGRFYAKLESFPFFQKNVEEVNEVLTEVFKLVPEIERHMMNSHRKGIRKRMINVVAGPIVYATFSDVSKRFRGLHQEYNDSIIHFMNSLSTGRDIEKTLERVSSCHSTYELPPLMQIMLQLQLKAGTASLQHTLAKKSSRSKFQTLYRIFPSTVFLGLLKAGIAVRPGSGLTTKLLLAKPLGGLSLMQRMVYEVLSVEKFKKKAKALGRLLPSDIQKRCLEYTKLPEVDAESSSQMSKEEIMSRLLSSKPRSAEEVAKLIPLVRDYVHVVLELEELRALVDITGDERIENLYRVIMPTLQRSMFVDVTAKGSGYVRLMEVMLKSWKNIMQAHQNRALSEEQKVASFHKSLKKIQDALFTLFHNVYREDRSGNWRKLAFWLVNNWNASRLDIDIEAILKKLSPEKQQLVMADARKLFEHERSNILRPKGAAKAPYPEIKHCDILINQVASTLLAQALPSEDSFRDSLRFLKETGDGERTLNAGEMASNKVPAILYIEIVADYEDVTRLKESGYTMVDTSLTEGMSGTRSWLWVKKGEARSGKADFLLEPITEVRVVFNNEDEERLQEQGYIKIWKKLNSKGSGDIYLWYRRGGSEGALEDIVALPRARKEETETEDRAAGLIRAGYVPVDKSIFRKKRTKALEASGFWEKDHNTIQLWVRRCSDEGQDLTVPKVASRV